MTVEKYIEQVIQPRLQGDGGWVEFESLQDGLLTLVFRGECSKCLILNRCAMWIEKQIEQDLGKKVIVLMERKKPYFQDV